MRYKVAVVTIAIFSTVFLPLSVSAAGISCLTLSHNLTVGSRGSDVVSLQQFLISQNFLAAGNDSGYFGKLTQAAVQSLQQQKGIVSSGTPATTGYGALGPKTRTAIQCSGTSQTSSTPKPAATPATQSTQTAPARVSYSSQGSGSSYTHTTTSDTKQIDSLTRSMKNSSTASPSSSSGASTQLDAAVQREVLMQQLAQTDPRSFIGHALSSAARATLPATVQTHVESKQTLTGTIEVVHVDDFSNELNDTFLYHLNANGQRYALYFADEPPAMTSGAKVQISGFQLGSTVVANGDRGGTTIRSQPTPEATGAQNTLVILITKPGQANTPTKEEMKSRIFSGEIEQYFEEQSYGKLTFAGDVTDWISDSDAYGGAGCYTADVNQAAIKNYLLQHSIDLSQYGRLMYVTNRDDGYGCATIGKSNIYFNGTYYLLSEGWITWGLNSLGKMQNGLVQFSYSYAHEMGHGLGVDHANSWECQGPTLDRDCKHLEYGNSYDVMGDGEYSTHFNAFYKDLLGWFAPSEKVNITTSGQYALAPLEAQSGVRAAIVRNPVLPSTTPPTYLEYRRPLGFDAALPSSSIGLLINQIVSINESYGFPRLLAADYATHYPTTPGGEKALLPGKSFSWDSKGVSINMLSAVPSSAAFNVTLSQPVCDSKGIGITDVHFYNQKVSQGGNGFLAFTLTNNDGPGCIAGAPISVSSTISDSSQWDINQYPNQTVTLNSGDSIQSTVGYALPATATVGDHTIGVTITDSAHNKTYTLSNSITVSAPPKIDSVTPTQGLAGSRVVLGGSGFNIYPSTNTVTVQSSEGSALFRWSAYLPISADSDSSLSFTFPTTLSKGNGQSTTTSPGVYTIFVTRDDDPTVSNAVSFSVVSTHDQSLANFSGTPTSGAAPLQVSFSASSLYQNTSYSVDFGDGTPVVQLTLNAPPCAFGNDCSNSYSAQTSHSYASVGSYTATLYKSGGVSVGTVSITVTAAAQSSSSNFNASPGSGTAPLAITFSASQLNSGFSYSVDFGDNTTAQLSLNAPPCAFGVDCSNLYTAQISHTYTTSGTYNARLLKGCPSSSPNCPTAQIVVDTASITIN